MLAIFAITLGAVLSLLMVLALPKAKPAPIASMARHARFNDSATRAPGIRG